ncbi:MAG: fibrobacter succinogenes major paralogous domain-containing protein, partial [Nitrospirota bacterium]
MKKVRMFLLLIAMIAAVTLTACGGGGGGGGSSDSGGDSGGGGNTTVTDIDGNVYNTVTIGAQVWMKENLKATKYRNSEDIPTTIADISGETSPKYQWAYGGNINNAAVYGRLYTWYAATDSRGLCPTGWHVPTNAEWTTLTDYLGTDPGGKMKEAGTAHWTTPNTGADNSSGFTAL